MERDIRCPVCGDVAEPIQIVNEIFYDCNGCSNMFFLLDQKLFEYRGSELPKEHGFVYIGETE